MLVFTPNGRLTCYGSTLARLLARHTRAWHARGFFVVRKRSLRPPAGVLAQCSVPVSVLLSHSAARSGRHLGDVSDQNVYNGSVRSTRPGSAATRRSGEEPTARAPSRILTRRPPHRPGGRREGASDALFLTGTATARQIVISRCRRRPSRAQLSTGISISGLNHSRRLVRRDHTPHGFAAPQPRPRPLSETRSRGSGAFAL